MKGEYNITLNDNRVRYEFTVRRQVTIILGHSGTGKSTLCDWVSRLVLGNNRDIGIHCNIKDKLEVIRNNKKFVEEIKESSEKIFFIDENNDYLYTKEFANAIQGSDCYFVIATRSLKSVKYLTFSVEDIYELGSEREDKITINRFINRYNVVEEHIRPELVITEDSHSGYQMIKNIFNCEVVPACGKDNVYNTLRKYKNMYSKVYIIVDGAAFGNCIGTISLMLSSSIVLFTPESFEWLLLQCQHISKYLKNKDLLFKTYDYCDSREFISWERFYTDLLNRLCLAKLRCAYNKSSLPQFIEGSSEIKSEIKKLLKDIDW